MPTMRQKNTMETHMNTERTIKKYRRRVSEERVERAARGMVNARYGKGAFDRMPEAEQNHHLWQARAALEAELSRVRKALGAIGGYTMSETPGAGSPGGAKTGWGKAQVVK